MDSITLRNIQSVAEHIQKKQNVTCPFYATRHDAQSVLTDMDHFPYRRFYRGAYNDSHPRILEREAGFRPLNNTCYKVITTPNVVKPEYCWEFPCSHVKPCAKNVGKCNQFIVPP